VALAVIVVAPVTEEFFFRGFFYRALRTRLSVWAAALIDGLVFGALHFQGPNSAVILPVIAVFGVGQCLVYERTGSLFAVIAIHAAFNTVATLGYPSPLPA
jgi:membrane protease YdiL (CAAX protease family)